MAENTADDAPNDAPAATPIESPLAPRFSGQTYRDRAATPDSDDSDEGPSSQ